MLISAYPKPTHLSDGRGGMPDWFLQGLYA
jgi:hypothetical protein